MYARYCTQADAVQVFVPDEWRGAGGYNESLPGGILIDIDRHDVPMGMAVLEPGSVDLGTAVPAAAARFGMDGEAILGAMRAAMAVPDRAITIAGEGLAT